MVSKMMFRPVSLLLSVISGALAGAAFTQVWRVVGEGDEAPKPTELQHSAAEVLLAAALHGAVFGVVRAAVDRLGAKGYHRLTGRDPS
jgi:hypothetical protein